MTNNPEIEYLGISGPEPEDSDKESDEEKDPEKALANIRNLVAAVQKARLKVDSVEEAMEEIEKYADAPESVKESVLLDPAAAKPKSSARGAWLMKGAPLPLVKDWVGLRSPRLLGVGGAHWKSS